MRERERSMGGGAGAPGACLPRSRRWTTAPGKMIPPTASPHGMPQHHQPTPEHLMVSVLFKNCTFVCLKDINQMMLFEYNTRLLTRIIVNVF